MCALARVRSCVLPGDANPSPLHRRQFSATPIDGIMHRRVAEGSGSDADWCTSRNQGRRATGRPDPQQRPRAGGPRPRRHRRDRGRSRNPEVRRGLHGSGGTGGDHRRGVGRRRARRQGQGTPGRGTGPARCRPGPVRVPAPGAGSRPDRRPDGQRGDVHRLRDGHRRPRRAAAAVADVAGGRADGDPGRCAQPRSGQRWRRPAAGRRARRPVGRCRGDRRWRGGGERDRDGGGTRRVGDRPGPGRRGPRATGPSVRRRARDRLFRPRRRSRRSCCPPIW